MGLKEQDSAQPRSPGEEEIDWCFRFIDEQIQPPATSRPIEQLSPLALAYLGDAIYELFVRCQYLFPPKRMAAYHRLVVNRVRAESQAEQLRSLEADLTDTEREILRRGRNAATRRPQRLSPEIYQQATSLETLIGYLYLRDPGRLNQLLAKLGRIRS